VTCEFLVLLQVMMNSLWFDKDLKNATDTPRIHHQLVPNEVVVEKGVLQVRLSVCLSGWFLACNIIH